MSRITRSARRAPACSPAPSASRWRERVAGRSGGDHLEAGEERRGEPARLHRRPRPGPRSPCGAITRTMRSRLAATSRPGPSDWTLSGATVTDGNQPFDIGTGGSSSLRLTAGATATSAPMCIDARYPHFRLLARNTGRSKGALKAEVLFLDRKGGVTSSASGKSSRRGPSGSRGTSCTSGSRSTPRPPKARRRWPSASPSARARRGRSTTCTSIRGCAGSPGTSRRMGRGRRGPTQ